MRNDVSRGPLLRVSLLADDDPEREVYPHEVLKPQTKKSRKIAVVGDNRRWTSQMTEIAKNADILVGTTISSFSVDLATDRFFRNDYVNYFFNETGVYHWTKAEEKFPLRKNSLLIFIAVLPSWKMC